LSPRAKHEHSWPEESRECRLALFSVVIGFALLLTGIGFVVLDYAALHRRRKETGAIGEASVAQPGKPAVA
jgi:hypothetical protein